MNDDFSEIFNKFSDILKEKNIDLNNINLDNEKQATETSSESDFSLDINTILKIKEIISKINQNKNCPRNKLLYSLEPYLGNNKKEKLEQYIKIANLLSVIEDLDLGVNLLENKKGYDLILIITLFLLIF